MALRLSHDSVDLMGQSQSTCQPAVTIPFSIQGAGHEADGDTAMTHRKGEIIRDDLKHKWPYHVALRAEKVRVRVNREVILRCRCPIGNAAYSLRRDDSDFVVFCFAKPEDAEAFAKRFGGR
jgi:hypothetical protein